MPREREGRLSFLQPPGQKEQLKRGQLTFLLRSEGKEVAKGGGCVSSTEGRGQ